MNRFKKIYDKNFIRTKVFFVVVAFCFISFSAQALALIDTIQINEGGTWEVPPAEHFGPLATIKIDGEIGNTDYNLASQYYDSIFNYACVGGTGYPSCTLTDGFYEFYLYDYYSGHTWEDVQITGDYWYMSFTVTGGVPTVGGFTSDTSQIVSVNPPDSITPISSPITFSVDYWSAPDIGDSDPSLKLTLLNQDTAEYQEFNLGLIDKSVGLHTLSGTSTELVNGLYTLSTVFSNSPNVYVATSTQFIVGSTVFPQNSLNSYFYGSTFGTSTPSLTANLLSFINVPQLLSTRVPFAYVFQFGSIVQKAVASTTVTNSIPTSNFEVTLGTSTYATQLNVSLFSTTTITHFLTPSYVSLFRTLMASVTYIGLGIFLFHHARSKQHL